MQYFDNFQEKMLKKDGLILAFDFPYTTTTIQKNPVECNKIQIKHFSKLQKIFAIALQSAKK